MEGADDFGDLYADLDELPEPKPKESDSISQEDIRDVPIGEDDDGKGKPVMEEEDGNGVAESSDSSDSEDDLRIVLNDEDGRDFPQQMQRMALGNGGLAAGWDDDEDDGDDLVLVTDADLPGKDQLTRADDGVAQSGAERGGASKNAYRSWHASHLMGGFLANTRTSTTGRGDRDHLLMPCSGGTVSSKTGIPVAATFSLPRNRTIFDIDVEDFVQKPWKHHGVDVTDYFNFGLDEESWKSYCKSMDLCRQQTAMTRFPFYEPSRFNQVFEAETVLTKAWSSEAARGRWEGKSSFIFEDVDKGGGFKVPRGRAIQVEGGFRERMPSTDIRRPRLRDSDVVIQIAMEDSTMDSSVPCEEELEHVAQRHIDGSVSESENGLRKSSSLNHGWQRFEETNSSVEHRYIENGAISRRTTMEVQAKINCNDDSVDPSRRTASTSRLADDSASCDQYCHSSPPSGLESHSVESKNDLSLEKVISTGKKISASSVSGLQESFKSDNYPSNGSRSDATKQDHEHSEDSVPECSISIGDQKHYSRRRRKEELTTLTDRVKVSSHAQKKRRDVSYSMELSYRTRTRKCDDFDARGHLLSYEETKMSRGYKRRRDTEKHNSEEPCVRRSHKKSNRDASLCRNQQETVRSYNQKVATRGSRIKKRDFNYHEQYHDDHVTRSIAREDCNQPISGYKSLFRERDSCLWQKKERQNNAHWIRMEAEYDDIIFEERYQEDYLHEMHGSVPYCDPKEEIFGHKFGKHVSHIARDHRSPERRYTYDSNSRFELNRSGRYIENNAKYRRYPDRRLLNSQEYRESPITDDRGWPDATSPTNHFPISGRSDERFVESDHMSNTRERWYKNKEKQYYFVPSSQDHPHSSYENALSFDNDDHSAEESGLYVDNIVCNETRRSNRLAKPRHDAHEIGYQHQEWDGTFSPEDSLFHHMSLRHVKSRVNHHSGSGQKLYDDHMLNNAAKKTITEESSDSDSRDHITFVSDFLDKGRNELAAIGRREVANMHVNGWKGKFPKRSNGLACGRGGESDLNHTSNRKLKDGRHIEEDNKQKKVPPHALRVEGSHVRPTSVHVERVREFKSEHSKGLDIKDYRDKNSMQQDNEDDEIEEGQLIEEPDEQDVVLVTKVANSDTKSSKTVGGYDSNRILETLAKMEKRRERFKEPIAPKTVAEKVQNPAPEVAAAAEQVPQLRPARKRRWAGS